jgi:hypothetical protein
MFRVLIRPSDYHHHSTSSSAFRDLYLNLMLASSTFPELYGTESMFVDLSRSWYLLHPLSFSLGLPPPSAGLLSTFFSPS